VFYFFKPTSFGEEAEKEAVTIKAYKIDDRTYFAVSGDVEDKNAALPVITSELAKVRSAVLPDVQATAAPYCHTFDSHQEVKNDRDGKTEINVSGCHGVEDALSGFTQIDAGGLHGGYFMGDGDADIIKLHEKYKFNGWNVTVGWPPSFAQSGSVDDWVSEPVEDTWILQTQHVQIKATSFVDLGNIDGTEGAEIYKGSLIFRPSIDYTLQVDG
jgi:hypothetical protein